MGLFRRLFGPRADAPSAPTPLPPPPDPVDRDWQAGDAAECLLQGAWVAANGAGLRSGPERGAILRVRAVQAIDHPGSNRRTLCLFFAEWQGGFAANCFRKLRPATLSIEGMLRQPVPDHSPLRREKEPA